jgi:tryptophan-rich sensory protein
MSPIKSILGLLVSIGITFSAAYVGSRFPVDAWYGALTKPSWNPPNWVFGPVWGLLYLLIAIAAWLVWREKGFAGAGMALAIFGIQLVLNAAWSWIFFGLHELGFALVEILVLWGAILWTILAFWRVTTVSGILLIPYLLWVTFASVLNFTLWNLNK